MKKILAWLIILTVASNTVSAFPLPAGVDIPAASALVCAGVDLSSPIAAINRLACTESPLRSQLRTTDSPGDSGRAVCDVIFTSPGFSVSRTVSPFGCSGHASALVSVPPVAVSCQIKRTIRAEAVRAGPGGSPSFLKYLVVLTRESLPRAFVRANFNIFEPGCFSKAGFFI